MPRQQSMNCKWLIAITHNVFSPSQLLVNVIRKLVLVSSHKRIMWYNISCVYLHKILNWLNDLNGLLPVCAHLDLKVLGHWLHHCISYVNLICMPLEQIFIDVLSGIYWLGGTNLFCKLWFWLIRNEILEVQNQITYMFNLEISLSYFNMSCKLQAPAI